MPEAMYVLRARARRMGLAVPFGCKKADLIKMIGSAEEAPAIASRIAMSERRNPDLGPLKMMNNAVAGAETEDQVRERIMQEAKERVMREEIEKDLRRMAQIEDYKRRQANKYNLTYDIADLREKATRMANSFGCKFQIDTGPDGTGLAGTYHVFARGKVNCGSLAQPLQTILRDVSLFCRVRDQASEPKRSDVVSSFFTGQGIEADLTIIGQNSNAGDPGDIAHVDIV